MTETPATAPAHAKPIPLDVAFLLSLTFIVLCFVNLISFYGAYPVYRVGEVALLCMAYASPVFLLLLWPLTVFLRNRWRRGRKFFQKLLDLLILGVMPLIGLAFGSLAIVFWLNGCWDMTEPLSYTAFVQKMETPKNQDSEGCSISFYSPTPSKLAFGGTPDYLETFPVYCRSFAYIQEGDSFVLMTAHAGFLGFPWVKSYAVTLGPAKTIGPEGPFWPFFLNRIGIGAIS